MKRILTSTEMYLCDRTEIETNTPSDALMERAARACADAITELLSPAVGTAPRVLILCGSGNNGGDGILCARLLCENGIAADICTAFGDSDPISPAHRLRIDSALNAGVRRVPPSALTDPDTDPPYALIADALVGIGLHGEITGAAAALIDAANAYAAARHIPTAAIDIASGICADTGKTALHTFRASHTLAINHAKRGHLLFPGAAYTGLLHILDIGIPESPLDAQNDALPVRMLTDEDAKRLLPRRPQNANKGTCGRILTVAGSRDMCGAAYLSALGAYRCGAGLVQILTPTENRTPLAARLPEAIVTTYAADDIPTAVQTLSDALKTASAVIIGPGLGAPDAPLTEALVRCVLTESTVPTVLDADALNCISVRGTDLLRTHPVPAVPRILTPHPGELSRLTGISVSDLTDDPIGTAAAFAASFPTESHIVLNAKNARSVITDGNQAYLNPTGTSALAKGGSGDVLTGITATLCAQGCDPLTAAALAAYLHGRAAECVTARMGARSPLASEIADALGFVLQQLDADVQRYT